MSFLFPSFLWALTALSIPVAIHLFNLRTYRTYYFSDLRFLQKVEQRTRSAKRLRHWVILALRLLALAALVLAFARPLAAPQALDTDTNSSRYYRLFIDNSLSMDREGSNGSLFNQALTAAADLIESLPPQAEVQVLSLDFGPEQARFYSPEVALELLDRITIGPGFARWESLRERLRETAAELAPEAHQELYFFSDFQASAWQGLLENKAEKNMHYHLVHLESLGQNTNLALDSLHFEYPVFVPGFRQKVQVYLYNYGPASSSPLALQMYLNDELVAQSRLRALDSGRQSLSLEFSPRRPGHYAGRLEIQHGEAYFDNQLYFAFSTQARAQVSLIDLGPETAFPRGIFSDSLFQIEEQELRSLDLQALAQAQLLVIEARAVPSPGFLTQLQDYLRSGGHLWLLPSSELDAFQSYAEALGLESSAQWRQEKLRGRVLNYEDPFYRGVFLGREERPDLAQVQSYLSLAHPQMQSMVSLENDQPLLARFPFGQGQVFVAASALDPAYSQLAGHPIFGPALINAALFRSDARALYLRSGVPGQYLAIPQAKASEVPLQLKREAGDLIPPQIWQRGQQRVYLPPQELAAGNYPLEREGQVLGYLALNPQRRESDLSSLSAAQWDRLQAQEQVSIYQARSIPQLSLRASQAAGPQELWPWFIALALFFGISELVLIKLWKT